MDALLREAEAIKTSLENSARFLHLMPNEAPKALNFLNQLNDKIGQLDRSDAKVQAKLPALEAAASQAAVAIDGASKAKEVDAELKAVEALLKKTQDAARAVIFVPGSSIRPAEADLKRLADAVAEFQPALDVFIGKYGALDKAKAKVPALQTGLEEAVNKLALASDSNQGALQIKKVVDSLKDTDAKQRHLKGVLFSRITSEKEASDIRQHKDNLWNSATELEQYVGTSVPGDLTVEGVISAAKQTVADADAAINKYQENGSIETLRVEVSSWSTKLQDFINRWHDEKAYHVAMEALEQLQGLLPALEQFGDVNGFVTNTVKTAKDNIEKANKNIPLAKARMESKSLVEMVGKAKSKLSEFLSRPHVQNYYNTAVEGLEELNALLPALEAYTADSSVVDLIKSAREQATKAEALVPAAKLKFESQPLREKVSETYNKMTDFINRPHVQSYYNAAVEAMEELKALVPALEMYESDSDAAYVLKNAREKMTKAEELIVKAGVQFAAEPLKNKVVDTYRKLDPFVSRWHVKEYYDTALEALDELQMLLPELEKYASDSNAASALTNARDMIKKTEAVLPQAKARFESGPLNDKATELHRKLDDFISRFHVQEYYNKALEAMEELKPLLIALEPYTADTYVADNIKNAQAKILKVEALLPEAKTRFESSIIINKIRPLLTPIDTYVRTWHHKPYYDAALEAVEEVNSLLPVLEQYASDSYASDMVKSAKGTIAKAEEVFPQSRARFEGEPLRDKVSATHSKLDKFIKDWYYKEYYNEAMEAIEELNALLPALEQYASDSYIAGVIKTAREKIAKAEANVPQAKVKFEAEPLKEQVNRVQGKLDKFIKDWYYQEYYNEAMEAIEELNALLPALEVYSSDQHVSETIAYAKKKIAQAEANVPQAKVKFESAALRDKVSSTQQRLDKFIKDWYYKEYYNDAMEAIEELNTMLPALEVYSSDSYVADTITNAKKKIAQAEANIPQAKVKFEAEPLKDQVNKAQQRLDKFIKDWYYKEYYNDAIEAIEELNTLLPVLETYASDQHVAETIAYAKKKIAQAEANIPQAKVKFEAEPLKDQVNKAQQKLDKFIKDWYYKEYYNEAMEAIEELNALLPALETYASDQHVAETIAYAKKKIALAEANVPQAKVKFEAEPLKDQVNKSQQKLDRFIKDWYYQEYYNEAMEAIEELRSLIPALEVYASDKNVAETIAYAQKKIAQAEANVPQAKMRFESAALKDKVSSTQQKLDKFIKDWYYQEYYNEAMEAIEELNALLPALEEYAADSYVADTITNAKKKIAQAEANIPQAKVKFEAEPLKDQVSKTQQRLDNFIKTWQHKEYYDTAIEAIEELSSLLPALECYASNQHVAEVIAHAKKKIAQAEANIPLAQVKFEAEPLKDQVSRTQQQLYNFIKTWQHQEYYNTAMEALEELSVLLPALEVYASDTHVSEVIANAKKQIALAEANIPQAKVKFESAPLKDQVSRSYAKLNDFIKTWQHKEYYNTAVETIDELNLLLPALEVYASDTHVAETIQAARAKITQAEANMPQAKVKFEAEPLRDKVGTTHNKLDNFIKTWQHKEYYDTALETIEELEQLLPALETYASDDQVARTIKTAREKIQAAKANIPQARVRFEAEPLRNQVNQVYAKLDNFIKTWQHQAYYDTAMEALEELEVLIPALEEFAADSGVASTIGAAKDRVQKAQANIPQAKLKFAAEPLRAALDKTASQLDNFIKTWQHEEYYNAAIEAVDEVNALLPTLEAYASDNYVASTIKSAKDKLQKAEANFPLAKARFEAKPLQEMVAKSSDKLPAFVLFNEQNFIKTWQHQEYYNTAMEGLSELEALLPALEAYASDSSVATTIKVAKDRIQAVNSVVPQAKLKYEAEPLKNQVGQVSAKLDNFIKSWHHEEYFNTASEALEELKVLVPALEVYASDSHVSSVIANTKEKIAKSQLNIPLAKAKYEAEPLRKQVQQHFDKLNRFTSQWWVEAGYNDAIESLEELSVLVPRLEAFSDGQAEATVRLAKEKILAAEVAMKSAKLKFQAEPLRKKAEALVSQLRTSSSKWTTQENFEQGLELQQELRELVKALEPFKEDSATAGVLSSAQQALLAADDRLSQLRVKYHLQPTLEDARKTTSTLSSFIAKWLQEDEYRKGVDAVAKSKRLLEKLAQYGANTEAQAAAEHLKQKLAEAEQQVKIAQAKHGVIEATNEEDAGAGAGQVPKKGAYAPYQPPKEIAFLLPEPTSFQSLAAVLDPPAGLNVGPLKTFVTPLEEQLARAVGTTLPINFNWENWVNHPSFASKPDGTKLELIKTMYQNIARQVVGALAQLIGADQVVRGLIQSLVKRVVVQYDPTDMVLDGRDKNSFKAERNRDGDLIITINMTQHGQIQVEAPLRDKLDKLFNIAVCQAQVKAVPRMKELTSKARLNAYLDIEFAPFGLNEKYLVWSPKDRAKACSRFWETLIPNATFSPTSAQILVLTQIMQNATPVARDALKHYVRRIAFTYDMDNRVSDPAEGHSSSDWYKIDVQDNNEVLITINDDKGDHETFRNEFVAKWMPVMAIFTEKYVSESRLRNFEKQISGYVGKQVEAEINWEPSLRAFNFKGLGFARVEATLRGLHTTQLDHLSEIWKKTSEWTKAGKRILGERIDRIVITLQPTPAAWALKLQDRTLSITMGYDQAPRRHVKLQDEIEWITEATIPIEIEAANRSCAKLTKKLEESAKKEIPVSINWEAFVSLPEFVGLGHDTVVGYMRNVYEVTANATTGLCTALTHEIGFKAITSAITSVLVVLEVKNISQEPVLSLTDGVMGVHVGYNAASKSGKILARRERVENLLKVIVQVHKALADERYNAVVKSLETSLGRLVPIEADWTLVDTPQFDALLPEVKSYVVESVHAGFPECVVTKGVLLTNLHPVGKECYSAKLKRVHFSVPAEGTSNKVENRDGELYVELSLVNVVAQGVFVGTWQIRGEEAFNALVPIAQYDSLLSYKDKVAERFTSTVGKPLTFQPNWDFTTLDAFKSLTSIAKRKFILDYCNETLELIFFGTNGLTELCALSLVRETIAAKVDSIVIKVDTSFNDNKDGKPTLEGSQLVLNVALSTRDQTPSWGQKFVAALGLRPTIIAHFLERHGPPNVKRCIEELTAAATAPLSVEMDLAEVLQSQHVQSLVLFPALVEYLTMLYDLPCKIVTGKGGVAWLCTNNPVAREQLLARAQKVQLVLDTTNSTPPFEGHRYQTQMYQVRIVDGAVRVRFNQNSAPTAVQDLGEVVEWELTPEIARKKEQTRIAEDIERQKRWEKEQRKRDKEYEKERRHRELMSKLH